MHHTPQSLTYDNAYGHGSGYGTIRLLHLESLRRVYMFYIYKVYLISSILIGKREEKKSYGKLRVFEEYLCYQNRTGKPRMEGT